jgi:predicted component of type VI protein secretion system
MPYIVVKSNGQEIDRRELTRPLVLGRAPDCDVAVPDILLSRRHCRIECGPDGWWVQDLQSKNGTVVDNIRLSAPRLLIDNDVVRLGRSRIIFHEGAMAENLDAQAPLMGRPLDPGDTLSGSMSGFTLLLPGEGETPLDNMPCPQPRPKDPPAYDQEELQTLLTAIASSSWDSIYAEAQKPRLHPHAPIEESATPRRVRPRSPTDFSLQVSPAPTERSERLVGPPPPPPRPRRKRRLGPKAHIAVAAVWLAAVVLATRQWLPLPNGSVAAPLDQAPVSTPIVQDITPPQIDAPAPPAPDPIKLDRQTVRLALRTAALYFPL